MSKILTHEECGCTIDDFIGSLKYLPEYQIGKMVEKGSVKAECEECKTEYTIGKEELEKILEEMKANPIPNFGDLANCGPVGCSTCYVPGCSIRVEDAIE